MSYPDSRTYEKLYEKYLKHTASTFEAMRDLAGGVSGKVVWDLCCGTGWLSKACLEAGAKKVVAVDESLDMTDVLRYEIGERLKLSVQELATFLLLCREEKPDVVFCRQAVNYWLTDKSAETLALRMPKGSVFVFNTFNEKPSVVPSMKSYNMDGDVCWESSWLVEETGMVHHVQVRQGLPPHATSFRWISQESYAKWLTPWFVVREKKEGRTSLYSCVRK